MGWIEWVLGIVATVVAGTAIYMGKVMSEMSERFVPRPQINTRFQELERRVHEDNRQLQIAMQGVERRTDKQLDRLDGKLDTLDGKLDQIFERLGGKVDKRQT